MKKTIQLSKLLLLVFTIPAFLFTACKKDEVANLITYDGNKFKIAGGIIENFGLAKEDPASYRMGLTFFSDGISYNLENNEFSGQGAILYANMYSSSSSDLAPGTYIYDQVSKNSLTFDGGVMIDDIAYSKAFPDGIAAKNVSIAGEAIEGGTIKITKDNISYTITISATTSSEKIVKATYKGPLPIIDRMVSR